MSSLNDLIARMQQEQHLGDGLYASFDGYQIRLRTPRETGYHEVFLDPGTLIAFEHYLTKLKETARNVHQIQALVNGSQSQPKGHVEVEGPLDGQGPVDKRHEATGGEDERDDKAPF